MEHWQNSCFDGSKNGMLKKIIIPEEHSALCCLTWIKSELKFKCPFGFQTTHLTRQYLGMKWHDYIFCKCAGCKKVGSYIYWNAFHKFKLVYSWNFTYSHMEHWLEKFWSARLSPASDIYYLHYCEKNNCLTCSLWP